MYSVLTDFDKQGKQLLKKQTGLFLTDGYGLHCVPKANKTKE